MRTSEGGRRAAVLGSPIGHSLSPVLHGAAYESLGLTGWAYTAVEMDEAGFPAWFAGLGPEWAGLSLTMPLKRVVIPLLASVTPTADVVGAVNTVTWTSEGAPVGANTDVHGIVQALRSTGLSKAPVGCVVGAGATAASAVAALAEMGCEHVIVQARTAARAGLPLEVAEKLGVAARVAPLDDHAAVLSADAVIVTLPGDAAGTWAGGLRESVAGPPAGSLLDVSYHPWPTQAAQWWSSAGGAAVGGFEMLLHQAAEQVRLMTGRSAPVEDMRVAGEKALASR
ncbi:shikimate dehydrogenase [Kineosporia succinea]|uniref:shikimate dehydrogenase (NADP(+)) n=1 Tax=Kineosporia succinea TaxID=84632 RepID=A0ABT9NV69_9ACTN|nr:shikimate dehydrogenase [Kineosporia succinea]MDP9824318.1 shikimate dehydrogenase [Kineosporia succinea]